MAPNAYGLAIRILGDGQDAEDAVQDAFLAVWRQADRLDPAKGRLSAYLLTVVHHRAVSLLRRRRTDGAPVDTEAYDQATPRADETFDTVSAALTRDAIQQGLTSLPPEQRETIELAYFGGRTHQEIGADLRVPLGTVKGRLRLGLEKLRARLIGGGAE